MKNRSLRGFIISAFNILPLLFLFISGSSVDAAGPKHAPDSICKYETEKQPLFAAVLDNNAEAFSCLLKKGKYDIQEMRDGKNLMEIATQFFPFHPSIINLLEERGMSSSPLESLSISDIQISFSDNLLKYSNLKNDIDHNYKSNKDRFDAIAEIRREILLSVSASKELLRRKIIKSNDPGIEAQTHPSDFWVLLDNICHAPRELKLKELGLQSALIKYGKGKFKLNPKSHAWMKWWANAKIDSNDCMYSFYQAFGK